MITWLVSTSLRLRVSIVVVTVVLLIVGSYTVNKQSSFDVFPEFSPPLVEVQTEGPGLSTSEVETLITIPVEGALNGTSWLKKIRSKSVLGLSSVVLYFEEGTDVIKARQLVQERVSHLIEKLPSVAKMPVILSPLSSTSRILKIGLSSEKLSQMEMTTVAKWKIRPRIMAIPGVANVAIWGQRDRQIQVLIDPDNLHTHGITASDVVSSVRDATAIGGGGFIDTPNQRLAVSHILSLKSPEDLSSVPVAFRNGVALTLGDVAELRVGFPPPIGDAVINDGPGLLLIVEKEPWGNTLEVTRRVEYVLEALRPGIKDIEIDPTIFRPATFIEMSLHNLNKSLLIGCILVIIVLAFFLNDWRTALISVLAIPTSLVIASLVLHYRGGTINTMVLAGLVIALGELVDDAVIDVENIMRRLRLNRETDTPQSAFMVVLNASLEVRSAVVYGSVIVVLVLIPVFFLEGLAGSFFRPLAFSYVLAIMSSLFVALTLTPALALMLLPEASGRQEPSFVKWLKARYRSILPALIMRPKRVISFLVGALLLTLVSVPFLGEEFLPNFKEHDFLMHWVEKPGTSLQAMERITARVSKELRTIPGVRNFGSHIGRSEVADEVVGPNFTELWISIDPEVDYDTTVERIQEVVNGYPGLYRDLLTYLRERIKEVLTGSSATIVVRIYGENLDILHEKASEVRDTIAGVKGVADLKVQPQIMVPQVEVRFRPEAAAYFGLSSGKVREAVGLLVNGVKVGEFYEDQNIFDVVVMGIPHVRNSVNALRSLRIETPTRGMVPLNDVANVIVAPTPNKITRESASRYTEVTCNVQDRDLGSVSREIENIIGTIPFMSGYHPEILGEYVAQKASRNRIIILSIIVIIAIFLVLHASFGSVRLALLVFLALPFALIGGVVSAFIGGGVLSLGSLIGFITVLGISARNSIMLISHYNNLEREEDQPFNQELIIRGAIERLVPILMTALTTGLALVPIIIGGILPGQEIEHPMAIVIIGGLVSSTLLNLIVMPVIYWKFGATNKEKC
ncbi:MAG: efflux RND transporter permease subunit [Candidatus Scalindua sp. AMX11]|nr:MAG: AcrB/AcrD/AcrF family protein [Candidatus Scalindua sp.]NOG82624.1 efflux RND transporter permease subunit [Planctomycetota bacterium]RZV78302.1 MAG: efflux RND transporter permease subunit [Candidatus Scalindua sp. SCAELEC01]TDE65148.1 MAG: efflux RND transporter permease subunit [Candidatus Scalindua sp. AMX11]GJQ59500.1 MAG: cation transporter [Candidatus Scalindua sp.]